MLVRPAWTIGGTYLRPSPSACLQPDGSAVVAWVQSAGVPPGDGTAIPVGVSLRRVAADGAPLGQQEALVPVSIVTHNVGHQVACAPALDPALAWRADGTALVVWESLVGEVSRLQLRRFSAGGKPLERELTLYTAAPGARAQRPTIVAIPGSRRFAVAWWEGGRGWLQIFSE